MMWEETEFGRENCYGGKTVEELGLKDPIEIEYYYDGQRELNNEFVYQEILERVRALIKTGKSLSAPDREMFRDLYGKYNYGLYAHFHSFVSSIVGRILFRSGDWPRDWNMTEDESFSAVIPSEWPDGAFETFMSQVDQIVYREAALTGERV